MKILERPAYAGIAGVLLLLLLYFGILTLAQSFDHAISQFRSIWYWIVLLAGGFGVQAALYTYVRNEHAASASVAAAGGVSATSMVACCAHHITDFLPILGLSAAIVFLAKYQTFFIIIGVLSNLNGTIYMLSFMQKHRLGRGNGALKAAFKYDMGKTLKISLALSAITALAVYLKQ